MSGNQSPNWFQSLRLAEVSQAGTFDTVCPIKISISRLSFAPLQNTDFCAGIHSAVAGALPAFYI
ncbi:hypothetical protein LAV84_22980 [Rhizobium sp. VS19-DR104.2]|uniref:hypothetical protein n=1 Tax=unclassified Rhizobium TaxID=2613769 RepID=UPI001C5A794E|nr:MULTISPECIES: hypothetical protein [unclassified Rhizobium]MBZ5762103.1 hypothetical protein [Rhizobium sp. VS19-DR96]MBZ5768216.1 hypothetical protein [Rhizobium sp. VS19-DR129.2]MBZ5775719.1 hypothetical protein [Rhizobium sp. VS19-DRK62.2]MBZ5786980.1 hypothetical protein [Rhizobium sp. VS19-DR121]MBZ5804141.1 hypothetical protein [Rhizobium sp. VS19-DR181]